MAGRRKAKAVLVSALVTADVIAFTAVGVAHLREEPRFGDGVCLAGTVLDANHNPTDTDRGDCP